jgi:GxxExxY protein
MFTQKFINDLAYNIVGCAIEVHKMLGPGLLESIYEKCLREELEFKGYSVENQRPVKINYRNINIDFDLRLDILVNDLIIVEIKAVEKILPIHSAQLLTYLKLLKKPKGLLINFFSENITKSLISLVTEEFAKIPKE